MDIGVAGSILVEVDREDSTALVYTESAVQVGAVIVTNNRATVAADDAVEAQHQHCAISAVFVRFGGCVDLIKLKVPEADILIGAQLRTGSCWGSGEEQSPDGIAYGEETVHHCDFFGWAWKIRELL